MQNDIKRVVAYSTLSQLGYMTVALGASAYSAAIFHLMTHAFFKALLFLAAGSVIIAMHHEQDIRKMGGIRKYMPITYWTSLIGSLALIGFPGFVRLLLQGRSSKPCIALARAGRGLLDRLPERAARRVRHRAVLVPHVLPRLPRRGAHGRAHARRTCTRRPWVVTVPLILLAIPSAIIGWITVGPILFGGFFGGAIVWSCRRTTCSREDRRSIWHGSMARFFTARFRDAGVLARAGRRRYGLVPVPEAAGYPGERSAEGSGLYNAARSQVLLRRFNEKGSPAAAVDRQFLWEKSATS